MRGMWVIIGMVLGGFMASAAHQIYEADRPVFDATSDGAQATWDASGVAMSWDYYHHLMKMVRNKADPVIQSSERN